jgi:3-hydroxy-5-phosphonooxypentane-2,4-dione thiolase
MGRAAYSSPTRRGFYASPQVQPLTAQAVRIHLTAKIFPPGPADGMLLGAALSVSPQSAWEQVELSGAAEETSGCAQIKEGQDCSMPEADKEGERYSLDRPQQTPGFFLKGSHQLDWGMKNRMARVFDPTSGRTVMLAVDHGYFQGPTTGLERIDLSIVPLLPNCDALFCTRGILRSVIPAECGKPMVLRASGGPSILREELSDEQIAMDMDDAVRLNAAGVGIQVFIGGEHETRSVHNMTRLVDAGLRSGIPVMGITAVGKAMVRDAKYFRLACRIIAELGAQYVKTYYVDKDFETVTASCPVPIVMAGGKKLPELEALTMAHNAVQQGAGGVDMGRNIFQSDAPKAMIAAVAAVVHKNMKPKDAFELFKSLRADSQSVAQAAE